jgi:acyl-coenzyme A thioesterase PaaI-like protein
MEPIHIQSCYPPQYQCCYGCGVSNSQALGVATFWDGTAGRATFLPRPEHTAVPGFVYGGLLASLVDCHGVATAAAAIADDPHHPPRLVTASLHVHFLRPTPLGPPLELVARLTERRGRKAVVQVEISAQGQVTVRGEVVAAPIPAHMAQPTAAGEPTT